MNESRKKVPPIFIAFERYDCKTSFGFDDFGKRISPAALSVEILHIQSSSRILIEESYPDLLNHAVPGSFHVMDNESIQMLRGIEALNPGIELKYFYRPYDSEKNTNSSVTICCHPKGSEGRIHFFGPMNGRKKEMLEGILFATASTESILSPEAVEWAASLKKEVRIKVFVSHVCPSCPPAAIVCGALSIVSPYVFTDIIDVHDYKTIADKFGVIGLPRIVVNEAASFAGDFGPRRLISDIRKGCG